VTGELNQVLAGVAVGGWEDGVEAAVDRTSVRVVEAREACDSGMPTGESFDYPRRYLEGPVAAQAYDGERGPSGRSSEGGDGIREHAERNNSVEREK
jgi:hypothetical protein